MHGETLNLSDECVFTEWAVAGPEIARVITEFEVAMLTRKNAVFKQHDEDSHEVGIIDAREVMPNNVARSIMGAL